MKRRIFFWLEKLKITPAERKTVSGLLILLVVLSSLNMVLSPSVPFEEDQYLELEKQFNQRTAQLKQQEQEIMSRYYPDNNRELAMKPDTTTSDSSESSNDQEEGEYDEKERINVNKADQEALESLHGIGPTYAGRIITYRKENGGFDTIEELKKIDGIGEKRLDNLKPFVKLKDSTKTKN